jgi:pyruvate-formate lyase-activating enzyme
VAFTGGDLLCRPEFYAEACERIKRACGDEMWVLLETNGFGLTSRNLELLASAGVDSFWLDIKAYDSDVYRKLCGTENQTVLEAPARIVDAGFVLEVLTLYIPGWVETEQIRKIAEHVREVDASIPFTLLAFFPEYKLKHVRPPTLQEFLRAYSAIREAGLRNVKLGNWHVVARTEEERQLLLAVVGREALG